jgi:hypothetical protein
MTYLFTHLLVYLITDLMMMALATETFGGNEANKIH